ncbi:MAG: asparagine--tRNA ligase [Theionarchaea archaeon]|nr:asparagine--tRNA ligase [Theionarchaea archaeon]MBU7019450.1 asparagine--tRNA ligase [Theionarchaea archaeon]MBU7041343.1 asparagine--tRNA ligase [Theionarchaea archaeon]
MKKLYIQDLRNKIGQAVELTAWVHRKRTHGSLLFLVLRDSTGIVQASIKKDQCGEEPFNNASAVTLESVVTVKGVVVEDRRAPAGIEVRVSNFNSLSPSQEFPLQEDTGLEVLLDYRHLHLRSIRLTNIMKARHYLLEYLREFFNDDRFWEVYPPILTVAGCEGGSTLFGLDYYGDTVYLSQSAQLYLEVLILSLEKVYAFTPSFRAEKSRTPKHVTEYWHLEQEAAYYDNEDNMKFQENMVSYVCQRMADQQGALVKELGRDPGYLKNVSPPFYRLTYDKALEKLADAGIEKEWGDDLGTEDEYALTEGLDKPLFVWRWPRTAKPFYMKLDPQNDEYVLNDDLLAPEGHSELIGGSQRIHDYDELVQRMEEQDMDPAAYEWYIDLRKYGSVPHSGFGLGTERLLKWMLNLEHIRDVIPFPRTPRRYYP